MQRSLDTFTFSASDLNNFLACEHLVALDLARVTGKLQLERTEDAGRDLVVAKGMAHEEEYLASLKSQGLTVLELTPKWSSPADVQAATRSAMEQGADVIYQASFWNGVWRGTADFLIKVERPSALGDWSYEALDTKLARSPKPYFVIQLCFYSELIARLQGVPPERLHIALGNGEKVTYRVDDFAAYYRRLQARFQAWVAAGSSLTRPFPVAHCGVCQWSERCGEEWHAQDHLSLVANIRRSQIQRLEEAGFPTLAALATAQACPAGMSPSTFATLKEQAALQLHHRETGEHRYTLLTHEPGRGFALLPPPSEGDIFFDMEGDPYVDGGLEYLFGAVHGEREGWRFTPFWAHDRRAEREAFERFIDFVMARRERYPDLHVYHYAQYEETALKRLACQHGTREEEVDTLLREHVLVDLFRVVRQGLRISQPSYSIKKLETFYMEARAAEVKTAGDSIVAYERWMETGDDQILQEIGQYNEEDCVSTRLLRDWLLERRAELEGHLGLGLPWPEAPDATPSEQAQVAVETLDTLTSQLTAGLPEDLALATPAQRAQLLLADLLDYHRREEKPLWWAFFHRCAMTPLELVDDAEAIGQLTQVGPSRPEKRSLVWRFDFPPQEHKVRVGTKVYDPATGKSAGEVVAIDDAAGWLELKRGPSLAQVALPTAVFPHERYAPNEQKAALRRLAGAVCESGIDGAGSYRALRDLLLSAPPRVTGRPLNTRLQPDVLEVGDAQALACALDESVLVLQGPPGAGKTYTGARVIVALLAQGKRVGVGATSHKAIHNLLEEVEHAAVEAGLTFCGLKKATADVVDTYFDSPHGMIESIDRGDFTDPAVQLVAGTAWLFPKAELDGTLDVLVLDEAGQISLADALAMGMSARNVILLGDPQQLPQVAQGVHPRGSGRSVLEHMLDSADTIPPDRGLFLSRTWRMHPHVTSFISTLSYEGRLHSAPGCEQQGIDHAGFGPAGLRYVPVGHQGNAQASREEGEAILDILGQVVGTLYTDKNGETRALKASDVLVVAPYNMQVDLLKRMLPAGVRVGTVDKFQGQEAPVVIFSMATSSGEDMPRNLEFLFNRNRLNVAISRAKCLAILVASPNLLDIRCGSIEQMSLVNGLCRFVELAREQSGNTELFGVSIG